MDRKKILIASGLTVAVIVFISSIVFISLFLSDFNIVDFDSSLMASEEYSDPGTDEFLTYFNNSTPKALAISTAQLTHGVAGFYGYPDKVYLTTDGKYWMVHVLDSWDMVDAKTGMVKDQNGEWISLDEAKASYIADIQHYDEEQMGKPQKININGKEIWKVPINETIYIWDPDIVWNRQIGYVYVDLETGKSKRDGNLEDMFYNLLTKTDGWLTLKQIDSLAPWWPYPFKDALRTIYPE